MSYQGRLGLTRRQFITAATAGVTFARYGFHGASAAQRLPESQVPGAESLLYLYRPTPGARESSLFEVAVDGRRVFVEAYKDIHYAHFPIDPGGARVEIVVKEETVVDRSGIAVSVPRLRPIQGYQLDPAPRYGLAPAVSDRTVEFFLPTPAKLHFRTTDDLRVDLLRGGPRLFLFADPPEQARPEPGEPGVRDIRAFGVDDTGSVVETERIQAALDSVGGTGGVLFFPPGTYLTGTIRMRSDMTVYLSDGALLQGTNNPDDYPIDPGRQEGTSDYGEFLSFSRLVYFDGVQRARITGRGVIDGDGVTLRGGPGTRWSDARRLSNLIRVTGCDDVEIDGVVLRDSCTWTMHLLHSSNVRVTNVKVIGDPNNLNNDGAAADSCTDILVDGLFYYGDDDAVIVKATNNSDLLRDPENVTFRRGLYICPRASAMKLGTESNSDRFRNILFEDNDVVDSNRAIALVIRDGATYQGVRFRNDVIHRPRYLFWQEIGLRGGFGPRTPGRMHDVVFEGLGVNDYHPTENDYERFGRTWVFNGYDEDHMMEGLAFRGVTVNGAQLLDEDGAWEHAKINFGPNVARPVLFTA